MRRCTLNGLRVGRTCVVYARSSQRHSELALGLYHSRCVNWGWIEKGRYLHEA
jgi:hypothetical protein